MNLSKIIIASICSFSLMGISMAEGKDTDYLGATTAETGLILYGWRASKLRGRMSIKTPMKRSGISMISSLPRTEP